MTTIISAMAFKGGATKTFTITQLAAACARAGLLTVVIDADMQGNATRTLGLERSDGLYRLLVESANWKTLLQPVPKEFTNRADAPLVALTGGFQTSLFKRADGIVAELRERMRPLSGWADVVLIDTAPGYDDVHAAIHAVSDYVILPTTLELDSVESLDQTFTIMKATISEGGRVPKVLGVLPNRFVPKYGSHINMYDMLKVLYRRSYRLFEPMLESVACLDARTRCMSLYAHAENLSGGGWVGRRYDKRSAIRATENFDSSVARVVLEVIRKEMAA